MEPARVSQDEMWFLNMLRRGVDTHYWNSVSMNMFDRYEGRPSPYYWALADKLIEKGLIVEDDWRHRAGRSIQITPAGLAAKEIIVDG